MFFKKAKFQNFMSFQAEDFDYQSEDFSLVEGDNQDEGGSNGAGKTSMITDTISWAIFGRTVRGLKGDEVIHRKFKKDCFVYINLTYEGKDIWIKRHRKHKEYGDRLWLEIDGVVKEFGTLAQTEEFMANYFGIDFDLFRCTVIFAQEETFNFINSGNKAQKEMLSKIMKISFEQYLAKAKEELKSIRLEKTNVEKNLSILNSHLVEDEDDILKVEIDQWDAHKLNTLKSYQAELKEYRDKVVELSENEAEKIDTEELRESKEKLVARKAELKMAINLNTEKIRNLKNQTKNSEELFRSSSCPSCLRPIDGLDYADRLKHIDEQIEDEQAEIDDFETRLKSISVKIDKITKEIEEASNHNSNIDKTQSSIKILKTKFQAVKTKFEEKKLEENPYIKQKEDIIAKQKQIKEKIKKLEGELNEIDEKIPYYAFWELGFGDGGIKSFIFDIVCASLTTKTNKYLNTLTNGNVAITFDTQQKTKKGDLREKFDCEVITGGERVKYESYSGGEKRRISLAVDMALSELMSDYYKSKFNIMVMDEQTNYMDKDGRLAFLNLLKDVSKSRGVYVVDHDIEFKAMFDKSIRVVKKNGVSKIV